MENLKKKMSININLSGFMTLLTILFVGLKLCHVIDWSWWFVLAPLWFPFVALFLACLIIYFIGWLLFRNSKHNFKSMW